MAVNMSNVKQIMHNNKEVIKIEDSLGHIIWQKIAAQPFRRLEYIAFDGTNYCDSAEHNAYNRAYRLDFEQTGWNDRELCYPFGIWTRESPNNILLIRNERSNTQRGFEVCRISNSAFGTYPPETYMNQRIVAEMKWGSDTTISYRLRNSGSSDYIVNDEGNASNWNNNNKGNFFIGAINDGGGGTHDNANGMLVGKIYEVAIAGSNSFDDYGYAYVPCQRKSDGAIGFKQPHLTGDDSFHPLRNKADGSIVTNVTAHMGPVVEEEWDGVTYTIQPSPIPPYQPKWHTLWSGNRQIKATGSYNNNGTVTGDGITLVNAKTINTEESSIQLKIFFTNYNASADGYQKYISYTPDTKQSSPYTVTKNVTSNLTNLIGAQVNVYANNVHTAYVRSLAMLQYSFNSNHQLTIKTKAEFYKNTDSSGSATAQITITKIQAYY